VEVQLSTVLAIGTAVFTAGGAWFTVRSATQRLELQREKDTELAAAATEKLEQRVSERLKEYGEKKDDQARRIGRVEQRVSQLEGRLTYTDEGTRRRIPTAAAGIPLSPGEDD
jgi:hypothetical protein